jgi:hypothetical protein
MGPGPQGHSNTFFTTIAVGLAVALGGLSGDAFGGVP